MSKYYKGKYRPVNIHKYSGDHTAVTYRSSWERAVFKWLDCNENVVKWNSEETVIPYRCKTDNKAHRYFVDVKIIFKNGATYLIEIKPKKETLAPKTSASKSKRYITEVMTYVKNTSKWEAANCYCADRGWIFEVWTEDTLKSLGIPILSNEVKRKSTIIK
jgi:hypothetical protein